MPGEGAASHSLLHHLPPFPAPQIKNQARPPSTFGMYPPNVEVHTPFGKGRCALGGGMVCIYWYLWSIACRSQRHCRGGKETLALSFPARPAVPFPPSGLLNMILWTFNIDLCRAMQKWTGIIALHLQEVGKQTLRTFARLCQQLNKHTDIQKLQTSLWHAPAFHVVGTAGIWGMPRTTRG